MCRMGKGAEMKISFSVAFNIKRKEKPLRAEPDKQGTTCSVEHASEYAGPSMGFKIPPQQPVWK